MEAQILASVWPFVTTWDTDPGLAVDVSIFNATGWNTFRMGKMGNFMLQILYYN